MYEFVQKLAKKKKKESWDFNPGPIWLAIVAAAAAAEAVAALASALGR